MYNIEVKIKIESPIFQNIQISTVLVNRVLVFTLEYDKFGRVRHGSYDTHCIK